MLLLTSAWSVSAQTDEAKDTSLSRNIEIVKEYTPTIKEAGKINSQPELKSTNTQKINVDYSVWSTPIMPGNDSVPPLDYAMPNATSKPESREGFVKLGAGNRTSFVGEAYIPLYKDKQNIFDLYANHNSTFGKVRFTKDEYSSLNNGFRTKAKQNDNLVKAGYLRNTHQKELSAYIDYGYKGFNYYGYDEAANKRAYDSCYHGNQAFTNFDAGVRFRRTTFKDDKYAFDAQTNYQLFHTKTSLNEHNIITKLGGQYKVDNGLVKLDIGMQNTFLGLPDDDEMLGWIYSEAENVKNNTVISLAPAYVITGDKAMINIGAKGYFSIGQGRLASITPDIYGSVTISKKYWYLYCGVTGDYKINNYHNMAEYNRYVSGDFRAENTYIPIDVYLGSKINIAKIMSLDLNASYKVLSNPYFFVNDVNKTGKVLCTDSLVYGENDGLLSAGATLSSNIKGKIDVSLGGKINKWALDKDEQPWMLPSSEIHFNASYLVTNYLRVKASYNYAGGRKALVNGEKVKMNNLNDLSLGVTYKAMSFLNIYADVNNILNKRYESWYGYTDQGFNFIIGLAATF